MRQYGIYRLKWSQIKALLTHENTNQENILLFALKNQIDEKPFGFFKQKIREIINRAELKSLIMSQEFLSKTDKRITSFVEEVLKESCSRKIADR